MRRRQRRWVEEDDGRERKEEEEEEEEEGEKGERGETEGVGVTLVEWREESVVGNIVAYSERERERERDGFGCTEMNWVGNFKWLIPNDKRTPLLQIGVRITGLRAKTGDLSHGSECSVRKGISHLAHTMKAIQSN